MKISTIDAAQVIHEATRAVAPKGTEKKPAPVIDAWTEQLPEFRDDRGTEIHFYLNTGEVPTTVANPALFTAIVDALR